MSKHWNIWEKIIACCRGCIIMKELGPNTYNLKDKRNFPHECLLHKVFIHSINNRSMLEDAADLFCF